MVPVKVNQAEIKMELDTGASVSIVSETTFRSLWSRGHASPLQPSHIKLRIYTGESLVVKGSILVLVQYQDQEAKLPLTVVAGSGTSLMGRDWLEKLRLDWQSLCVFNVRPTAGASLADVLESHEDVFNDTLGLIKGTAAKLHVDPSIPPQFCPARSVPYALRDKVSQELDRLEQLGIIDLFTGQHQSCPWSNKMAQCGFAEIIKSL